MICQLYQLKNWAAEFKKGRESLEDNPRSGRPAVGISCERVENIFHKELGMLKVSTRWVPHLLTPDQEHTRLIVSQANLAVFEAD